MVYLLHFSESYKHARHYLGYCEHDLDRRIEEHRKGQGARLMEVITAAGITFTVARTWEGDRTFERRLKNRKKARALCPVCRDLKQKEIQHGEQGD